ncbi:VOC family protein [Nocardioides sp. KR10-350]|uniref:VOC family protein n=1 Tax=Nocardioides cheoyonin TaxID=3156615 RepID=UPI0032B60688
MADFPTLLQPVLDCVNIRETAEFYRRLLGYTYRAGEEPPAEGSDEPDDADWIVLLKPNGERGMAFQQVDELPRTTWPEPGVAQQYHLDLTVPSVADLEAQHERVLALGATLRFDRSDTPEEPLRVYADPAGHLFCIFVA